MTTRNPSPQADAHASHDRLLISARVAGDLRGRDLERADALLASCHSCGALEADLRTIGTATRQLATEARRADRDFRLTAERAAELSRGSLWRRLTRPLGRSAGDALRPLAGAFTTLGVAGLLLAALPFLPMAGGATTALSPVGSNDRGAAYETIDPQAVPPGGPEMNAGGGGASQAPTGLDTKSTDAPGDIESLGAPGNDYADGDQVEPTARLDDASAARLPLIVLSLAFLAVGLGLLLVRRSFSRRR